MARIVVLDAGPLGLVSRARGVGRSDECRDWIRDLALAGVDVVVPEIADYEVRRELIRVGAVAGLRRLDLLVAVSLYDPITTPAMRQAAEFWAHVRRAGMPTADPRTLDADCILAAKAALLGGPGDSVVIARTNVGHLGRFPGVGAESWDSVTS